MSDTWVDPRTGNPWLQGLPTLGDLRANEFGVGEFTFDPDALEQRDDLNDLLREYLKMRGIYLEDIIPNLPQEVEAPDPDWTPYTSDILDTYRNDEAYNLVAQLVDSGMGFEEAKLAVEQEAMDNGWAMPMLNPGGQQQQFYNGQAQPSMTVAQYNAQQAAEAANAAGGVLSGDPTKDSWSALFDSGAIVRGADGSFAAAPPSNFDMSEFGDNAKDFMTELSKERRSQEERDAAIARYEEYVGPRYLIDVDGMERNGLTGGKTDYAVEWSDNEPKQDLTGAGQQPAALPSASLPIRPPTSWGGLGEPLEPYQASVREAEQSGQAPSGGGGVWGFDVGHMRDITSLPTSDMPGSGSPLPAQNSTEWRRSRSEARQRLNNQRVNATNKADQEYMNAGYQELLRDYKQNNAVASPQQQRLAMMDEFMNSYYRGGA